MYRCVPLDARNACGHYLSSFDKQQEMIPRASSGMHSTYVLQYVRFIYIYIYIELYIYIYIKLN